MNCCKVHIPLFFVFKEENPQGMWTILSFLCPEVWKNEEGKFMVYKGGIHGFR